MMTSKKTRWLPAGLLCVALGALPLWPAHVSAQGGQWETLTRTGLEAHQRGDYAEAEKQFEAALEAAEALGPEDPRLPTSLDRLAGLYRTQGRYAEAESLYKSALAIMEKALGPEHPHVARSLDTLALLSRPQGRYAEAEPLYKRSMAFVEKALESSTDLAAKLLPAVVNVSTVQVVKQSQPGSEAPKLSPGSPFEKQFPKFFDRPLGSGFIVDSSGLLVTNDHLIAEAEDLFVVLHDGTRLKAEVVGRDKKTDLALLRVKPSKPLHAVQFGDSDEIRVGDQIFVMYKRPERPAARRGQGARYNPYYTPVAPGGAVSAGIVWARGDPDGGPYDDFIQAYPAIRRGGAPMFNLRGEVIGINTAMLLLPNGHLGFGFAVPSAIAAPVIEQLIKHGRVRRGWLGVHIQAVAEEIAEALGLEEPKGALVAGVIKDGPAEKGNIKPGDVILSIDGREVTTMRRLPRIVAETPVGKEVTVEVWRKGGKIALGVMIGELPR